MNRRPRWPVVAVAALMLGCGPRIYSFDVTPRSLCHGEETQMTYRVRGTPTLYLRLGSVHSRDTAQAGFLTEPDTLEFRLVVSKGGTDSVRRIAILQFGDSAHTSVAFVTRLAGDTIVAGGVKSPERWSDRFAIVSTTSGSGRPIEARHAEKVVQLDAAGDPSTALRGIPVEGPWELRSLLTATDSGAARASLDRLSVNVTLQCRRIPR